MEYNNRSTVEFRSNIYPADRDQELIDKEFIHNYPSRCAISTLKGYHPIGEVYKPIVLPNGKKKLYVDVVKCTDTNCDRFEECKKEWIDYTDEEFEMLSDEGYINETEPLEIIDVDAGIVEKLEEFSNDETIVAEPPKFIDVDAGIVGQSESDTIDNAETGIVEEQKLFEGNEDGHEEGPIPEVVSEETEIKGGESLVEDYSWADNVDLFEWYWGKLTEDQLINVFDFAKIRIQGFRNAKSCFANQLGITRAKAALLNFVRKGPIPKREELEHHKEIKSKAGLNSLLFAAFFRKVHLDIIDKEIVDLSELKPKPVTIESLQSEIEELKKQIEKLSNKIKAHEDTIKAKDREITSKEGQIAAKQKSIEDKEEAHTKKVRTLENTILSKDDLINELQENVRINKLLNGLTRNVLLLNLKPTDDCCVPFAYSCITYESLQKNELPNGSFTEVWYIVDDEEDDLKFWSYIENLREIYDGFGMISLSESEINELGLEVL